MRLLLHGRGEQALLTVLQASAVTAQDFLSDDRLVDCRREDTSKGAALERGAREVIAMQALASRYGLAVPPGMSTTYQASQPLLETALQVDPERYALHKREAEGTDWE
ncbi:hypothetical protein [Nonomuraea soli]|uniref:Uncharacterized protein n=1 Tax=Nonomuraea soli TaxID=1032476 RepID=A0A7W0CVP5_9ACTN|nr:hypothetical protein [Nonomuraea soli]MBA2898008.1 hypothetical protein [Nonomuraea soli]